jgi:ABC-type Fe3+ transport system permease subunit
MTIEEISEKVTEYGVRLKTIEESIKNLGSLTESVNTLAVNMQNMLSMQSDMNDRLRDIERQPVDAWRTIRNTIITGIVGAIVGAIIGLALSQV